MAENKDEIGVAFAGGIYIAPLGSVAPTSANPDAVGDIGKFPTGTFLVGYVSEDGVKITPSSDNVDVLAWPRGEIVRNMHSNGKVEITFKAYQKNADVSKLWFGKEKNADGAYVLDASHFGDGFQIYVRAIDTSKGKQELWVAPDAIVSARAEVTLNHKEVTALDFTILCHYDDLLAGHVARYDAPWLATASNPLV